MRHTLVLIALSLVPVLASSARAAETHFVKYAGPYAYGLEMTSPWEDGGTLVINLPEHLEVIPRSQGILRHNDREPRGHWQVAEDGLSAVLDVDSSTMAGLHVKGTARVVAPDRIELTMRIDNGSDVKLPGITPLYCTRYRGLTGFPQWLENFKHTYVLIDGKAVALAEVKTENTETEVKGGYVRGCPQHDVDSFPKNRGGLIEEKELDAALIAVEQLEGKRKVVVGWTPGKSMLSNAAIPCVHGDPYYGVIPAGESREVKGVVWFTEKPVAEALKQLAEEGHGAPLPEWSRQGPDPTR